MGVGLVEGAQNARAALPSGFSDTVALSGLTNPTQLEFASDGSILVDWRPLSRLSSHERARAVALMTSEDASVDDVTVREVVAGGRFSMGLR